MSKKHKKKKRDSVIPEEQLGSAMLNVLMRVNEEEARGLAQDAIVDKNISRSNLTRLLKILSKLEWDDSKSMGAIRDAVIGTKKGKKWLPDKPAEKSPRRKRARKQPRRKASGRS